MKRRILALFLAVAIMLSGSACGKVIDNGVPDDRIIINISLYSGGFGTEWLTEMLSQYNNSITKYWFNKLPDNKEAGGILSKAKAGITEADIYIAGSLVEVSELASGGYLEDLSSVYEATLEGEDKKVKEKVKDYDLYSKAFVNSSGNICALPYTDAISGIVYDHDLFEEMDLLHYPSENGLPRTIAEFKQLLQEIKDRQLVPLLYSDWVAGDLIEPVADAIWAQYEGYNNYQLMYTYNGNYVSPQGATTAITPQEGYKLYSTEGVMEGRFKAAEFVKDILLDKSNLLDRTGMSNTEAQAVYVTSHANKQVGMILDGYWWENEAKTSFAVDAKANGDNYAYGKRDFRMMPLPVFDGMNSDSQDKNYYTSFVSGCAFAMKQQDREKAEAILDFFKAYVSNNQLKNFTKASGAMLSAYDYTLTEEEIEELTPFSRSMIEMLADEKTVIIKPDLLKRVSPFVSPQRWEMKIGTVSYSNLYNALKSNSVEAYKNGVLNTYNSTNWKPTSA